MLVKCKHYSTTYPSGIQKVGDIFELPKKMAESYASIGWVEILPEAVQPKGKRTKIEDNPPATDLTFGRVFKRG